MVLSFDLIDLSSMVSILLKKPAPYLLTTHEHPKLILPLPSFLDL
jgi:hypothetical protein